ncbi:MAG: hypothetical protein H0V06_06200 [Gemmatimonadetes bacterium]|nr:hypothetical protein [Gemmatimonadota bacterium]MBA3970323.1 hypothetical protein [Gemmatimonadota bacterium]MDQ3310208.1 hypothetical protein [Gemmatimonadota bacterium]
MTHPANALRVALIGTLLLVSACQRGGGDATHVGSEVAGDTAVNAPATMGVPPENPTTQQGAGTP